MATPKHLWRRGDVAASFVNPLCLGAPNELFTEKENIIEGVLSILKRYRERR